MHVPPRTSTPPLSSYTYSEYYFPQSPYPGSGMLSPHAASQRYTPTGQAPSYLTGLQLQESAFLGGSPLIGSEDVVPVVEQVAGRSVAYMQQSNPKDAKSFRDTASLPCSFSSYAVGSWQLSPLRDNASPGSAPQLHDDELYDFQELQTTCSEQLVANLSSFAHVLDCSNHTLQNVSSQCLQMHTEQAIQDLQYLDEVRNRVDIVTRQAEEEKAEAMQQLEQAQARVHEVEKQTHSIDSLEKRLAIAEAQLAAVHDFSAQSDKTCADLMSAKLTAEAEYAVLRRARDRARDTFTESQEDLVSQLERLQTRAQQLESENSALRSARSSFEEERHWLNMQIQTLMHGRSIASDELPSASKSTAQVSGPEEAALEAERRAAQEAHLVTIESRIDALAHNLSGFVENGARLAKQEEERDQYKELLKQRHKAGRDAPERDHGT